MSSSLDQIATILGDPFFKNDSCIIYNMDCVEGMTKLAASAFASVDLTVTSPPYNIGKTYENVMPVDKYLDWSETWINRVKGLTGEHGSFWLNLGYLSLPNRAKAIPISYLLWDRVPFYLIQEVVWNYGAGVASRKSLSPRNEKLLWYVQDHNNYTFNLDAIRDTNVKYPNQKKGGVLRCNPLGKNPSDVWQIPKVTSGAGRSSQERTTHPAQFPVELIERIVRACSNTKDLVLDPFLGSGTVAEVAVRNNRLVVGFEINTDYCQIAAGRIKQCTTT